MKEYLGKITLIKNKRGVYDLDTSKGCCSGLENNKNGCYDYCYAAKNAKIYGYDFSKTVLRKFESDRHKHKIIKQINKFNVPFIRIGTSGDPSENWGHTLDIIKKILADYQLSLFPEQKKEIVIITKHWNKLTKKQLSKIRKYNICINTSLSALDSKKQLKARLNQYNILKKYCKSVLRIVSCDFNKKNKKGLKLSKIQDKLFKNENIIDTIFRCSKNNINVKSGLINIEKIKFLNQLCYVSRFNKNTYFGKCNNCLEQCGIT